MRREKRSRLNAAAAAHLFFGSIVDHLFDGGWPKQMQPPHVRVQLSPPYNHSAATLTHVWFTYLLKHMFAHVYLCIFVLVYLHFCTCANIIYKGCRVVERWGGVARHIWATLLTWFDTKWCEEEPSEGKGQFRAWSQNKDLPWHILGLFPKLTFWNIAHFLDIKFLNQNPFLSIPLWRESSFWPLSL